MLSYRRRQKSPPGSRDGHEMANAERHSVICRIRGIVPEEELRRAAMRQQVNQLMRLGGIKMKRARVTAILSAGALAISGLGSLAGTIPAFAANGVGVLEVPVLRRAFRRHRLCGFCGPGLCGYRECVEGEW